MRSTMFCLVSMFISVLMAIDVITCAFKNVGSTISEFGTRVESTSMVGLSFSAQLGILAIAAGFLAIGIVKAYSEDKEIYV